MRRVTTGETAAGARPGRAPAAAAPAAAAPDAGATPAEADAAPGSAGAAGAAAADAAGQAETAATAAAAREPAWRIVLDPAGTDWEIPEEGGEVVPLAAARATVPVDPDAVPETPARPAGHTLCLHCFGGGQVSTPAPCPACGGAGEEWCEGMALVCPACHGTRRVNVPCGHCGGAGWVRAAAAEGEGEPSAPQPSEPA